MKIVCHITTVHPRYDTRIFHKECKSLSKDNEVFLIVADGLGDEKKENIRIIDTGKRQPSRIKRMFIDSKKAYQKAVELNAEIYHFHDPELLFVGLKLKRSGKKVIFDVHEDVPRQILRKYWIPLLLRKTVSKTYSFVEKLISTRFDALITVTPTIADRLHYHKNVIEIRNYPILKEALIKKIPKFQHNVVYVGGITVGRGIKQMLDAFTHVSSSRFILIGNFMPETLQYDMISHPAWSKVDFKGWLDRVEISKLLSQATVGLVVLLPTGDYEDAYPVKLFEYMSAGLPVIASHFPLWCEIVEGNNCGICVNPQKPEEIADAIKYIINNDIEAARMGANGRKAVLEKYNWDTEEKKLLRVYNQLLRNL